MGCVRRWEDIRASRGWDLLRSPKFDLLPALDNRTSVEHPDPAGRSKPGGSLGNLSGRRPGLYSVWRILAEEYTLATKHDRYRARLRHAEHARWPIQLECPASIRNGLDRFSKLHW